MTFADEAFDILGFTKEEKYDVFKVRINFRSAWLKCTSTIYIKWLGLILNPYDIWNILGDSRCDASGGN